MKNTLIKKKSFFQKMAEILFAIYLITLYIFVDKKATLVFSQIVFMLFAGSTTIFLIQRKRIHIGKNVMGIYIVVTWIFSTVFWAQSEYTAFVMIKTMWQLFLLFFLVYNLFCEEENAYEYLLKCLYIAGIVLIVCSIYSYGISDTIEMMTGNKNARLGREINQENTFGILNATTCIVSFYYLFYKKKFNAYNISVLLISFLFSMSSGSRTALLTVCIGILFMVYKKYGMRQVYKVVAIVLILSIVFISMIQLPIFETINYRMEQLGKNLFKDGSGDSSSLKRINMITTGWDLYKERIFTGYGINNYRIVSRYGTYAHNNFIEILVDIGLIGFVLYYSIYWNALKNLWKMKTDVGKTLFCVFLVRFIMEVSTVTYYDKLHWILMAFFLMKPIEQIENSEGNVKK